MKKLTGTLLLCIALFSFRTDNENFCGKIRYDYSFTTIKGDDITASYSAYVGKEELFVINPNNYKAYNEKGDLTRMYTGKDNLYYVINSDKTAEKMDAATRTSKNCTCTKMEGTETIAGYVCNKIKMETDLVTTIYYYSAKIKIDQKAFEKHNFSEFNQYLNATDGALFLKFVMTDIKNDYIWTATATEILNQKMDDSQFVLPENIKLLN